MLPEVPAPDTLRAAPETATKWPAGLAFLLALSALAPASGKAQFTAPDSPSSLYSAMPLCSLPLPSGAPAEAAMASEARGSTAPETQPLPEGPLSEASDAPLPANAPAPSRDVAADAAALEAALAAGDGAAALVLIDALSPALPQLEDWLLLRRGDALSAQGDHIAAARSYRRAIEATNASALKVQARVSRVRALLAADNYRAEEELSRLRRRYPELPEEAALLLELGQSQLRRGNRRGALSTFRNLDLRWPGSASAAQARQALTDLEAAGVRVRPLSSTQQVERAERLMRRGPLTDARSSIDALLEANLPGPLAARTHLLAARLARHEGRFDAATQHHRRAAGLMPQDEEEGEGSRAGDMAEAAQSRNLEDARSNLARLRARRPHRNIATPRLFAMARIAARAGLREELQAIVEPLLGRNLPPALRVQLANRITGVASDEAVLSLLEPVAERSGSLGVRARYHQGRALMRQGRLAEAEVALLDVVDRDRGHTPFYGMWARLQLSETHAAMLGECGPQPWSSSDNGSPDSDNPGEQGPASKPEDAPGEAPEAPQEPTDGALRHSEGFAPTGLPAPEPREEVPNETILEELAPLIEAHGEAFPHFGRAAAYLRLGERDAAGSELYEAFLAWRAATGRPIRRAGLEAVARGANRPRSFVPFALRRARRALSEEARQSLVGIGEALGEYGVSTGFGGGAEIAQRPRAYAPLVEEAAANHGLDPNLLFAVMRVESVYQKDIVSYAGAIGLCQIMPRTGTLIAYARGKSDFTTADLLDPATNLDFAAWYLRSLIERFDGRLPLAIASYNGGPHNVRRWLRDAPEAMPLDTFVEHIPFEQTHRYVRRVLTHYQAYRAQQGLPQARLSTRLPAHQVDTTAF